MAENGVDLTGLTIEQLRTLPKRLWDLRRLAAGRDHRLHSLTVGEYDELHALAVEAVRRAASLDRFRRGIVAATDSEGDSDEDILGFIRQVTCEYVGDDGAEAGQTWAEKWLAEND